MPSTVVDKYERLQSAYNWDWEYYDRIRIEATTSNSCPIYMDLLGYMVKSIQREVYYRCQLSSHEDHFESGFSVETTELYWLEHNILKTLGIKWEYFAREIEHNLRYNFMVNIDLFLIIC
jgi:hypothetical protein